MNQESWPENSPDSLFDICLGYCVEVVGKVVSDSFYCDRLFEGLNLSHVVNQQLYLACLKSGVLCSKKTLGLFCDQQQMKLKRLDLSTMSDLTDDDLENILNANCPTELHVVCDLLSPKAVRAINDNSKSLVALHLTTAGSVLTGSRDTDCRILHPQLICPNLRFLTLNKLTSEFTDFLDISLSCMSYLTLLDISNSDVDVGKMENLRCLLNLQILNLHNVTIKNLESVFKNIAEVKSLR